MTKFNSSSLIILLALVAVVAGQGGNQNNNNRQTSAGRSIKRQDDANLLVDANATADAAANARANNALEEIRNILKSSTDSGKRQQLLRMIADAARARTGECPPTLPASFCRQPLTFFLWMKEVRNQEKERQQYDFVKKLIIDLFVDNKKPQ